MSMPLKNGIIPLKRTSGRGFKKCPSCGNLNGQRAAICRHENCSLRQQMLANRRPYDPIQLITYNKTALYSLRKKETQTQPRNFVQISEVTLALETAETAIVSRKAVCFVDTCKFDASNVTGLYCKHLNACTVGDQYSLNKSLPQAEVFTVHQEILLNLHITLQQKHRLWKLYSQEQLHIPAVQRLNAQFFAVKCEQTNNFTAGRLHVKVPSNAPNSKRESMYTCTCRKIKIILELDSSVVMQPEICDHLLLVLAAVLSQTEDRKQLYAHFINTYKLYWCPDTSTVQDSLENSLDVNFAQTPADVDDGVFIFDPNFLSEDVVTNIPDLSDIVMEWNPSDLLSQSNTTQQQENPIHDTMNHMNSYIQPPTENQVTFVNNIESTLNSSLSSHLDDLSFLAGDINISPTELELTDCNIELMDQFDQLTDQIDLCSEDLELPLESTEFLKANNLSFLTTTAFPALNGCNNSESILSCNLPPVLVAAPAIAPSPPPIELPIIAVVKPTETKVRKFQQTTPTKQLDIDTEKEPCLGFYNWLEYIIETVNESIQIQEQKQIQISFHVHEVSLQL